MAFSTLPKRINIAGIILMLPSLLVFFLMLASGIRFSSPFIGILMFEWGANFTPSTLGGELWRLITSSFLHYGPIHLIINMLALWAITNRLSRFSSPVNTLLVYFLSATVSGLSSCYLNTFTVSAGASGAIYGLYAYLLSIEIKYRSFTTNPLKAELIEASIYLAISVLLSKVFHFDNYAHLGGVVAGILLALPILLSKQTLKTAAKRPPYLLYFAVLIITITLGNNKDHWQVAYFNAMQTFYRAEDRFVHNHYSDFGADSLRLKAVENNAVEFDSALHLLEPIGDMPWVFKLDKETATKIAQLRKLNIEYQAKMIRLQSYIFHDSLRFVNQQFSTLPPIGVSLRMKIPEIPDEADEESRKSATNLIRRKAFYDSLWRPSFPRDASFFRLGMQDSLNKWQGYVEDYYHSGGIQMRGELKNGRNHGIFIYYSEDSLYEAAGRYHEGDKVGKWEYFNKKGAVESIVLYSEDDVFVKEITGLEGQQYVVDGNGYDSIFYANGVLKSTTAYVDGKEHGVSNEYFEDGTLRMRRVFEHGKVLKGVSFDEKGNQYQFDRSSYFSHPVGGFDQFYRNLYQNIDYSKLPKDVDYPARLRFSFQVDLANYKYNYIFYDDLPTPFESEAIKLIENGPRWNTGTIHGQQLKPEGVVYITIYFDPKRNENNAKTLP